MQELGLKIDCTDAVKAAEALERLAKAAEAAEAAIAKLNGQAHGGVVFQMVGDICKCEVLPSKGDLGALLRMHSSESR